jgi:hypothetical protein
MTEEEILVNLIENGGDPNWTKWKSPMRQVERIYTGAIGRRYVIYSMVFDRFILLDTFDPWMTFTTSKILSSKLSTTMFCIRRYVKQLTVDDCPLLFTISDEEKEKVFKTVNKMQTPIMMQIALNEDSIVYAGAPKDYVTIEQKQMLADVYHYARFCHRVIYAAKFADARMNSDDHSFFAQIMGDSTKEKMYTKGDQSQIEEGILWTIYRILYLSSNIDEAIEKLDQMWQNTKGENYGFKKMFDFYLDIGVTDGQVKTNTSPISS